MADTGAPYFLLLYPTDGSRAVEVPWNVDMLAIHAALVQATTPMRARVYNTADISIPNDTDTALTFNTERWDNDTLHSTSSNMSRLVATHAGLYEIKSHISFASNSTGVRIAYFKISGLTVVNYRTHPAVSGFRTSLELSTQYQLAAGDYVEVFVYQNSGGALSVNALANYSPEFMMTRLGA